MLSEIPMCLNTWERQTKTVVPALSEIQNIPYCLLAQCGEPITELVRMFQEGFALY